MPTSPSSELSPPRGGRALRALRVCALCALCALAVCALLEGCSSRRGGRRLRQGGQPAGASDAPCMSVQDPNAVIDAVRAAFNLPDLSRARLGDDWQIIQAGELVTEYGRWGWRWLAPPAQGVRSSPLPGVPQVACDSQMLWTTHLLNINGAPTEASVILQTWSAPPLKPGEPLAPLALSHPRYLTQLHILALSGAVHATRAAEELTRLGLRPLSSARAEADLLYALAASRPFRKRNDRPPPPPASCPLSPDLPPPSSGPQVEGCAPLALVRRGVEAAGGGE